MKLVIFDIDGTLTDTKAVDDKCFISAFQTTFGLDIRDQIWSDLQNVTDWGITEEIIQQRLKRVPTKAEYSTMYQRLIANLTSEKQKDDEQFSQVIGANRFIKILLNQPDTRIGIATGAWEKSALIKLSSIEINPLDYPFSNSDHFKSREEIMLATIAKAKQKYDCEFKDIVYFGDGAWDFKTCKNLGIPFIGIDIKKDGKLKKMGANHVFSNFEDAKAILNVM